ncbi:unnamed protein product [Trichobilharzia regenti]|nr:unnamed protein product [Trichobilharzia regenti]
MSTEKTIGHFNSTASNNQSMRNRSENILRLLESETTLPQSCSLDTSEIIKSRKLCLEKLKEKLRSWLDEIELRKWKNDISLQSKTQQEKERKSLKDIQPTYY